MNARGSFRLEWSCRWKEEKTISNPGKVRPTTDTPSPRYSPIKDEGIPSTKRMKHWKRLNWYSGMTSHSEQITVASTFHGTRTKQPDTERQRR
ncbi:hypothetical protein CCACVL1_06086 [Corchorus capsularis]|uniref:Uncharacterized protein n=1 Tax=Corchorus capsularis TaxID=210143 RepID=A0A1R3JHK4_COCAP|nr:hypothetical protein CCACVL1_06086 [Corchorus capsularis]